LMYYRANRTSVFFNQDELTIKGRYKYMPKRMKEIILKISGLLYENIRELKEIYSANYLKVCQYNGLTEILDDYFICDNDCVINSEGNYVKYNHTVEIDPMVYLLIFIYPAILATKL